MHFVVSSFGALRIVRFCAANISSGILPFQIITDFLFNVVKFSKSHSFLITSFIGVNSPRDIFLVQSDLNSFHCQYIMPDHELQH